MKSMTGYGRCQLEMDGREMTVEVKTVNHRFLDISYRLSRALSFLDDAVRKGVGARLARGHADVFVSYGNHRQDAKEVRVDTALAMAYQKAVEELAQALGKAPELPLTDYPRLPDVLTVQEKEDDQQAVRELFAGALEGALDQLIDMREQEGERMRADILEKIGNIERIRDQIAERAPMVVAEYREKLHQRIAALTEGEIDEARLITEVAIFADRAAIDEELPKTEEIEALMKSLGMAMEPEDIGINRQDTVDAFRASRDTRKKYLTSSMLWDMGELYEIELP